jgi:hypothetical protein
MPNDCGVSVRSQEQERLYTLFGTSEREEVQFERLAHQYEADDKRPVARDRPGSEAQLQAPVSSTPGMSAGSAGPSAVPASELTKK